MEGSTSTESPFRDYSLMSWMGPLMTGSYKPPGEPEDIEEYRKAGGEEDDYKYLSPADCTKTALMVTIATCNVSYALAKHATLVRDSVCNSDSNIVSKALAATSLAVALPILTVAAVVEGVARKIIGEIFTIFFMAAPPVSSGLSKEKLEALKEENQEAREKAHEDGTLSKYKPKEFNTLEKRHIEFMVTNARTAINLLGGFDVAVLAVIDLSRTFVANFNIFHSTSTTRFNRDIVAVSTSLLNPVRFATAGLDVIGRSFMDIVDSEGFFDNNKMMKINVRQGLANPSSHPLYDIARESVEDDHCRGQEALKYPTTMINYGAKCLAKARYERLEETAKKRIKDEGSAYHEMNERAAVRRIIETEIIPDTDKFEDYHTVDLRRLEAGRQRSEDQYSGPFSTSWHQGGSRTHYSVRSTRELGNPYGDDEEWY